MDGGYPLWDSLFRTLEGLGILGSLAFGCHAIWRESKTSRLANLIKLTQQHQAIWSQVYSNPELKRVLKPDVDLRANPIVETEEVFLKLLILHLSVSYRASLLNLFTSPEQLRKDVSEFFRLPIPRKLWLRYRGFQDADFVGFVDDCLDGLDHDSSS